MSIDLTAPRTVIAPDATVTPNVKLLVDKVAEAGVSFVPSLPDSWVKDVIEGFEEDDRFDCMIVGREESAIGLCAGAFFAGKKSIAVMGASGFMASIYAITKICYTYQIGFPIIITVRGSLTDTATHHQSHSEVLKRTLGALGIDLLNLADPGAYDLVPAAIYHSRIVKRPTLIGVPGRI